MSISRHPPQGTVVIVDDDPLLTSFAKHVLEKQGFLVETCGDGGAALATLSSSLPDVVCVDLGLPDIDGIELIRQLHERYAHLPIVVLTANSRVDAVVAAMRAGAYDYLAKPIDRTALTTTVRNAVERHAMAMRLAQLEREVAGDGYAGIVGDSPAMKAMYRELDQVANTDVTVLIHGESGTGKELVSRALHQHSARRDRPFVALNCAAIPDSLHESELFGHEKGAFTGANQRTAGRFEQAHTGTLFLDEVGELPPALQAKLLRVLQERRFTRVGGAIELHVDIRLIAATHRDLAREVREGRFREDLFFRLAVFELEVPPLRARGEDIPMLARTFLAQFADEFGRTATLSDEAVALLRGHGWPGNVRELQNAVCRAAVAASDGVIRPEHLPARLQRAASDAPNEAPSEGEHEAQGPSADAPGGPACFGATGSLEEAERRAVVDALARGRGNLTQVARDLGIGRTTLYRKLKKFALQ
ncbi:MAG: sigma-54 dependent transcriptional regulator [Kofleriaceae bacterium]